MEFRKCSINGISYGSGTTMIGIAALIKNGKMQEAARLKKNLDDQVFRKHPPYCNLIDDPDNSIVDAVNKGDKQSELIRFFFRHLSVCHSVSVEAVYEERDGKRVKTDKTRLSASSPDEQALVAGKNKRKRNFFFFLYYLLLNVGCCYFYFVEHTVEHLSFNRHLFLFLTHFISFHFLIS